MTIYKLLPYDAFTPAPDPKAIRLWQREWCERRGLRGRIIISQHGINGAWSIPAAFRAGPSPTSEQSRFVAQSPPTHR